MGYSLVRIMRSLSGCGQNLLYNMREGRLPEVTQHIAPLPRVLATHHSPVRPRDGITIDSYQVMLPLQRTHRYLDLLAVQILPVKVVLSLDRSDTDSDKKQQISGKIV